ncbi:hypothetical protein P7C73_g3983, partial [Tremellales sp. Uapishka_1]
MNETSLTFAHWLYHRTSSRLQIQHTTPFIRDYAVEITTKSPGMARHAEGRGDEKKRGRKPGDKTHALMSAALSAEEKQTIWPNNEFSIELSAKPRVMGSGDDHTLQCYLQMYAMPAVIPGLKSHVPEENRATLSVLGEQWARSGAFKKVDLENLKSPIDIRLSNSTASTELQLVVIDWRQDVKYKVPLPPSDWYSELAQRQYLFGHTTLRSDSTSIHRIYSELFCLGLSEKSNTKVSLADELEQLEGSLTALVLKDVEKLYEQDTLPSTTPPAPNLAAIRRSENLEALIAGEDRINEAMQQCIAYALANYSLWNRKKGTYMDQAPPAVIEDMYDDIKGRRTQADLWAEGSKCPTYQQLRTVLERRAHYLQVWRRDRHQKESEAAVPLPDDAYPGRQELPEMGNIRFNKFGYVSIPRTRSDGRCSQITPLQLLSRMIHMLLLLGRPGSPQNEIDRRRKVVDRMLSDWYNAHQARSDPVPEETRNLLDVLQNLEHTLYFYYHVGRSSRSALSSLWILWCYEGWYHHWFHLNFAEDHAEWQNLTLDGLLGGTNEEWWTDLYRHDLNFNWLKDPVPSPVQPPFAAGRCADGHTPATHPLPLARYKSGMGGFQPSSQESTPKTTRRVDSPAAGPSSEIANVTSANIIEMETVEVLTSKRARITEPTSTPFGSLDPTFLSHEFYLALAGPERLVVAVEYAQSSTPTSLDGNHYITDGFFPLSPTGAPMLLDRDHQRHPNITTSNDVFPLGAGPRATASERVDLGLSSSVGSNNRVSGIICDNREESLGSDNMDVEKAPLAGELQSLILRIEVG